MNFERGQIVEIEWVDSCGNAGWQSEKDILAWSGGDTKNTHHTIGYFVTSNDKVVVVVQSYVDYEYGRSVDNAMSIPLVAVLRVGCLLQ